MVRVGINGFFFCQLQYVCTFLCVKILDLHLVNQYNTEGLEWCWWSPIHFT